MPLSHTNSDALWSRAEHVLAGGPATLSKHPSRYPWGIAPKFIQRGNGARVWDVDGNEYIDMVAALGPIILGHNNEHVSKAVSQQIDSANYGLISSTLPTPLEIQVAEMLCAIIPGAEQVRFASNGADVTNGAVKLARYVTGKRHVVYTGYHGGHDAYLSTTDKHGGVTPLTHLWNHQVPFGQFNFLEEIDAKLHLSSSLSTQVSSFDFAAIVVEVPPVADYVSVAAMRDILNQYKKIAHDSGALFILDEVVTGFRYGLSGSQGVYGIQADLACFSKSMANGYPCAAITGPRDLMKAFEGGKVFLSTTFGANQVGLAACEATLEVLRDTSALRNLHDYGDRLGRILKNFIADYRIPATLRGNNARMVIDWHFDQSADEDELKTLWLQETNQRGVLFGIPIFPMTCYDEEILTAINDAARQAFEVIHQVTDGRRRIGDVLRCPVIRDVFNRYENKRDE